MDATFLPDDANRTTPMTGGAKFLSDGDSAPRSAPHGYCLDGMGEYWNTAITARMVVEACESQGVATGPILAAAGISPSVIADPEGRVTLEQMRTFWQTAVIESNDPAIGLHASARGTHGMYGLLDYLFSYSPTIGEGFVRFAEYLPLINNWATMRAEEQDDGYHVVFGVVWGAVPRTTAEYIAALLVERSRPIWGIPWAPDRVRFEFAAPARYEPVGEHERVFRCPVEFGADRTEIVISHETWNQQVRTSDPGLIEMLTRQAQQVLKQLPSATGLVNEVRAELQASLAGGSQRINDIAEKLGTSGRTLQRRLGDEGLTFAAIVDEVRLEAAKVALSDLGMSLAHVAYFVGFEEQSSFSRAFKRWTGSTPLEYRQAQTRRAESDWPEDLGLT